VGKRSPILGYNHNVRYRGLVFHVQTEDSGVGSPHLFTHLFHHGVIVSSRKLVYDAGSAEEAIKSLMQAQHKVTLKDLRRGHFDDKIDSYLGGTPGLLPRGAEEAADRPGESELAPSQGTVEELASGGPTQQVQPMMFDEAKTPVSIASGPRPGPPPLPLVSPRPPRERPSAPAGARSMPAPVDTTLKTEVPVFDLSAELQLELYDSGGLEDSSDTLTNPRRPARDTDMQLPFGDFSRPPLDLSLDDHSRPTLGRIDEQIRRASSSSDGIPTALRPSSPAISPPSSDPRRLGDRSSSPVIPPLPSDSRRLGERPSTINAATLPPARPISRPPSRQALTPPPVVSRPVTADERSHREAGVVEAHAPSPAELPPGERPGQYAQHKRGNPPLPGEVAKNERSGSAPIPAGLGRPPRMGTPPVTAKPSAPVPPSASSASAPISRQPAAPNAGQSEPVLARAPTPSRISPPGSRSGGVVMTRPAVIVGAPAKSVGTMPRIRKAREEEGRGFGQGLISEKSLDEVILAYLSEDADEK
jgi:hypothetical protein